MEGSPGWNTTHVGDHPHLDQLFWLERTLNQEERNNEKGKESHKTLDEE
jgi:hypothetical protein